MKKLSLIAAALLLASTSAMAVNLGDSFDVTVNFTSTCEVKTAATDLSFTYTAFGAAQSANTSTVFRCSRGLAPTFSFNDNAGTMTGNSLVAVGSNVTAEGVIAGIRYTLTGVTSKSQNGAAATAGAGGAGGSNGTADEYSVAITANIAGGQAGDSPSANGTHTRVLTITY